jgi:hypothetical protein
MIKGLSTKLSIEDYNVFLILTELEYQVGLIKEEGTSELLRFTIRHILNQVRYQPEYHILVQRQEQKKARNNQQQQEQQQQQQLHSQVILPSTTITAAAFHQHQLLTTYLVQTI